MKQRGFLLPENSGATDLANKADVIVTQIMSSWVSSLTQVWIAISPRARTNNFTLQQKGDHNFLAWNPYKDIDSLIRPTVTVPFSEHLLLENIMQLYPGLLL